MKKVCGLTFLCIISLLSADAQFASKPDAAHLTDLTAPQGQYQVVDKDAYTRIATQEEAMRDIKDRLSGIDQSIKDIKADVKVLMETNIIVHFLVQCLTLLIPGLIIAAFTVWLAKRPKPKSPIRARSA